MQYTINRPRPPSTWDFLQFPAWLFAYSWLSATGAVLVAHYNYWWAFPLALAGGVAAVLTIRQARQFDVSIWYVMNPNITLHQNEPEPIIKTRYVTTNKTGAASGVYNDHGMIDLPEHEWPTLARFVLKKDGVSRDGLISLSLSWKQGLTATLKNETMTGYEKLVNTWGKGEFALLSGTKLTPYGREYFSQILRDTGHSPTANNKPITNPSPRDDDGRTTANGGER